MLIHIFKDSQHEEWLANDVASVAASDLLMIRPRAFPRVRPNHLHPVHGFHLYIYASIHILSLFSLVSLLRRTSVFNFLSSSLIVYVLQQFASRVSGTWAVLFLCLYTY